MKRWLAVLCMLGWCDCVFAEPARAEPVLVVDGHLDEAAWSEARVLEGFRQDQPLTLALPQWPVRARLLARTDGLWVGVEVDTPPALRTRGRAPRDGRTLNADPISLLIDFAGTGQTAYEFTVSLSGTMRDGQADATGQFTYDWDARWNVAVAESPTRWTAEFQIPWEVVGNGAEGETRTIGLWVGTFVKSRGLRFSMPAVGLDNARWLRELYKIEVPRHHRSTLAVVPYGSFTADRVRNTVQGRAGLDLLWNSGTGHQVTVALKPDFGQVESDDVVVNFSAVETFYSDKRPFFTEGGALFDVRLPGQVRLVNTRRVGAVADGSTGLAPVEGALKYVGERGGWDLGAFAALEGDTGDGGQGRDFGALRLRHRWTAGALGYLGTWVDRPGLGYAARVDAVDADLTPLPGLSLRGRAVSSRRLDGVASVGEGEAYSAQLEWGNGGRWGQTLSALYLSPTFEINDFGYLPRANLRRLEAQTTWDWRDYPEGSLVNGSHWKLAAMLNEDAHGKHLPGTFELGHGWSFRSSAQLYVWSYLEGAGLDDLLTRGHGDVRLPARPSAGVWATTGRFGPDRALETELELQTSQRGLGVPGWSFSVRPRWVVNERFTVSGTFNYDQAPEWLLWTDAATLGTFRLRQLYVGMGADAFFGSRHELRLRLQWVGLAAAGRANYAVTGQTPQRTAGMPDSFSLTTLAFQARYRYMLGPLSDLYVVYGRGGEVFESGQDRGLDHLWRVGIAARDSDQLLVKLRYLF